MGLVEFIDTLVKFSLTPLTDTIVLRVVSAGLYLAIGFIVIAFLNKFLKSLLRDEDVVSVFSKLGIGKHMVDFFLVGAKYYFYFILLLVVLGRLGVSSVLTDILVFVLIVSAVTAIVLALRNIIPNAAAGIYISSTDLIEKGDRIEVGNVAGKVSELDLIHTVLEGRKGEKVIIPNSLILKQKLIKK